MHYSATSKASLVITRPLLITMFLTTSALFGCASTGVIQTGGDTLYIGKKDGSPGLGVSLSNKAAVYREADHYCRSIGKTLQPLKEVVKSSRPAMLGSTELFFKCVPASSTIDPLVQLTDQVSAVKGFTP